MSGQVLTAWHIGVPLYTALKTALEMPDTAQVPWQAEQRLGRSDCPNGPDYTVSANLRVHITGSKHPCRTIIRIRPTSEDAATVRIYWTCENVRVVEQQPLTILNPDGRIIALDIALPFPWGLEIGGNCMGIVFMPESHYSMLRKIRCGAMDVHLFDDRHYRGTST